MLYYIIRFVLIGIIVAAIIFLSIISRVKKIPFLKPKMSIWKRILYMVSLLCVIYLIFQPVEDYFLRFKTAEDSFNYSNLKGYHLITIEDENCAFLYNITNQSSALHTVTKHENGWGITDAHCEEKSFSRDFNSEINDYSLNIPSGNVIKNIETQKSFIKISGFFGQESSTEVYDSEGRVYKPLYRPMGNKTEKTCIGYYTVYEGDIPDTITFYYNDEKYVLYGK